jgi:hypothetical protein
MKLFIGRPLFRNLISALTSLVRLTEADRIQAGIFLGEEENDSESEHKNFPASMIEKANPRVARDP